MLIAKPVAQPSILKFYETDGDWRCNQSTHSFSMDLWLSGADRTQDQNVTVAGGTADVETGQLLIIKRCLCPIAFCNYKFLNIGLFPIVYTFIYFTSPKFLQADSWLSLHAIFHYSVGDVILYKENWLPGNLTSFYYKTANFSVISTDWSHLWYSASSCYVLRNIVCDTEVCHSVDCNWPYSGYC